MKKILCPTDFSDTALNAIAYAAKLSKAIGADLTLYHVESPFELRALELISGDNNRYEALQKQLERQSLEVSRAFHIGCYPEIERSYRPPSSAISEMAQDFDLVVMGTNGPDDLFEFLTGSHTYNTILKTQTPMMLIPPGFVYSKIERVAFAYNYLKEASIPLNTIFQFVRDLECDLTVLQVVEDSIDYRYEEELNDIQRTVRGVTSEQLFPIKFHTLRGTNVAESIDSYVNSSNPDVLALCAVNRSFIQRLFHKSVLKKISAVCSYPVYVFHE